MIINDGTETYNNHYNQIDHDPHQKIMITKSVGIIWNSQLNGREKKHVPNHQPENILGITRLYMGLSENRVYSQL